ncbi:uncharacterized protein LOC131630445 [Vicia villosa]|uniref:uncharacterized protein LOC131630445 n=1 Tax=Vicia villosa TaxID=3911 RepID=UPI00273BDB9A|nr:uncharacterized protein LOC131630445 [Vicia villosa]
MFERIEHKLCLRHLYANFKKKFGGGALIRDLMMGAAKATYHQAFLQKMTALKAVDPQVWEWLMGVHTKSWCKHAFSYYPRCDVLMNNISESFNATILCARDKPILTMCEWIRKYLMNRCSQSTLKLDKWPHKIMPIPRRRLDAEVAMSGQWLPTWAMGEKFQVTHAYNSQEFIVDIAKRSCSCNFWQLVGIPCRHVVAALGFRQQNPELFVHECYSREKYALCYGFPISPINGQDMWPIVESEDLLPPDYKKGPGRPRKLRIRETGEEGARRRLPGVSYRCTRCDKIGHNIKSCKSKVQDPSALKRKKKGQLRTATNASVDTPSASAVNTNEVNEVNAANPTKVNAANPTEVNAANPTEVNAANPTEVRTCEGNASEGSAGVGNPSEGNAGVVNPSEGRPRVVKISQVKATPAEVSGKNKGKAQVKPTPAEVSAKNKGKAQVKPMRKRVSERIKENWFKKPKPFTGPGSAPEQPFFITEEEDSNESQRKMKTTPKKNLKKTPKKKSINDL